MRTWKVFVASTLMMIAGAALVAPDQSAEAFPVAYSSSGSTDSADMQSVEFPFAWEAALTDPAFGIHVHHGESVVTANLDENYVNAFIELEWDCGGFCDLEGEIRDPDGKLVRTIYAQYGNQPWSVHIEDPAPGDWDVELWPTLGGALYEGVVRVTSVN